MYDYKLIDGKWHYKEKNTPQKLKKKEHDLPAFRAVYGIEATVKAAMKKTVEDSVHEMGRKLLSSLTK